MSRHPHRFSVRGSVGRAAFLISLAGLLLFPAVLQAGVIRIEGNTYRLNNERPVLGIWDIGEKLAYTKDVAIVVAAPDAAPRAVQSLLELLGTLKVPTVLTKKADYDQLVKRGVLRPSTAP